MTNIIKMQQIFTKFWKNPPNYTKFIASLFAIAVFFHIFTRKIFTNHRIFCVCARVLSLSVHIVH